MTRWPTWVWMTVLAVVLLWLLPDLAFADNCTGPFDCHPFASTAAAAAAAAAALAAGAAAGGASWNSPFHDGPKWEQGSAREPESPQEVWNRVWGGYFEGARRQFDGMLEGAGYKEPPGRTADQPDEESDTDKISDATDVADAYKTYITRRGEEYDTESPPEAEYGEGGEPPVEPPLAD